MIWILPLLLVSGCFTNEADSAHALDVAGYTNVHLGGYAWFMCHDDFATQFTATNPQGSVSGAVCCGIFSGCYVRF